mmetsp:Transcript_118783/g.336053  ORF Transcript_118783/g.336053 Transcript_118783/m.336053 type:complete len:203 (-) Transcript_118783:257-865(-)
MELRRHLLRRGRHRWTLRHWAPARDPRTARSAPRPLRRALSRLPALAPRPAKSAPRPQRPALRRLPAAPPCRRRDRMALATAPAPGRGQQQPASSAPLASEPCRKPPPPAGHLELPPPCRSLEKSQASLLAIAPTAAAIAADPAETPAGQRGAAADRAPLGPEAAAVVPVRLAAVPEGLAPRQGFRPSAVEAWPWQGQARQE